MKWLIHLEIIILILLSCTNEKNLQFCEGVSPEGKGVNCGKKFSTGDLTVLIKSKASFGVDKVIIYIYKYEKRQMEKKQSIIINVKEDSNTATTNIPLYNEGRYRIKVIDNKKKVIAEGDLEIIDTISSKNLFTTDLNLS